jgi:uncharacterized protein (DUF433 family)
MNDLGRRLIDEGPVEIASVPGVMGGMPCIKGTRVPAETILASINAGESHFDIFAAYPYIPVGSIEAVIEWAQANDRFVSLPVRRVPVGGFGRSRG